ncbi:MAG: hypothetical protein JSU64_06440 [candidate division WOR-3 bacterium]|nr:MAG: hypothetical protein JSU64_06440 [candidate division WOR-3 bacterium]
MRYELAFLLLLIVSCGDNHIVQRAAEDYFPFSEGYWWQYSSQNDTILVEVEPLDTISGVECFPVTFNGRVEYIAKRDASISQYVVRLYNFAGIDYTILEDFIVRIELPLVKGNSYHHVLADSILVAGQSVSASYEVIGDIIDFSYDPGYGDVYEIRITTIETRFENGLVNIDTAEITEYYAPGIGMIRFQDETSDYNLIETNIP